MNPKILLDSMGEMVLPSHALWGAQTERARQNFAETGFALPMLFNHILCRIKHAAAEANHSLGLLSLPHKNAIVSACNEICQGQWDSQFVVDLFQTGSATSTHMNANEVIANRANTLLEESKGHILSPIHPNDHVNMGQSSNDIVPTAMHISIYLQASKQLLPNMRAFLETVQTHADQWDHFVKPGRTHLQDATPIRIGQIFTGYAYLAKEAIRRIEMALEDLRYVAIGGTAVGTGINTHPRFAALTLEYLSQSLGIQFMETPSHFSAQSTIDPVHAFMGQIQTAVTSFMKIANDLRWLSSGPRTGFAEFILPELQPGSSIMPGKVNPVILESFLQIACQILGSCTVVGLAAQRSEFELNVFLPITIYNSLSAIHLLSLGLHQFTFKCLKGLQPNTSHCRKQAEKSLALATVLAQKYGYDQTAAWVKKALDGNKTLMAVILEEGIGTKTEIKDILDPLGMTGPK